MRMVLRNTGTSPVAPPRLTRNTLSGDSGYTPACEPQMYPCAGQVFFGQFGSTSYGPLMSKPPRSSTKPPLGSPPAPRWFLCCGETGVEKKATTARETKRDARSVRIRTSAIGAFDRDVKGPFRWRG